MDEMVAVGDALVTRSRRELGCFGTAVPRVFGATSTTTRKFCKHFDRIFGYSRFNSMQIFVIDHPEPVIDFGSYSPRHITCPAVIQCSLHPPKVTSRNSDIANSQVGCIIQLAKWSNPKDEDHSSLPCCHLNAIVKESAYSSPSVSAATLNS